jgi:hypothetical protein
MNLIDLESMSTIVSFCFCVRLPGEFWRDGFDASSLRSIELACSNSDKTYEDPADVKSMRRSCFVDSYHIDDI